jgi:hypothetical protein
MNNAGPAFNWSAGVQTWLAVIAAASAVCFVVSSLLAARARGSLIDGIVAAGAGTIGFLRDVFAFSPRRLWAIAWHSILESIRRRMLLAVFLVLVVIFMFGGWFLPSKPTEQVKVYVSFVFLSSTLIAIAAGWLLACLSLPSDIRDKTIHTVVTKPVRRLEIVIGRIIGLTVISTAILVLMGVVSYVYMTRSVGGSLRELEQKMAEANQASNVKYAGELKDSIEQIKSRLIARVPVYGALHFTNPPKNVGKETIFRGYLEGNSTDAAIWQFRNVPIDRVLAMQQIPLEMTFSVFRTTKGEIGKGVIAELSYINPKTGRQVIDYPFEVREYYTEKHVLDNTPDPGRKFIDGARPLDAPPENPLGWLFQGSDGELVVVVRCLSGSQYLGMAQPDLYVLLDTASFGMNFAKGMIGVWLRVFLIICVAVMFSTFLSSYVAMLATAAVFFGGLSVPYLTDLAHGKQKGGGPMEAAKRIVMHDNLERELEPGIWTDIIKGIDAVLQFVVRVLTHVLPDLGFFNTAPFVANGFDISGPILLANIVVAFAYAFPITIFAYFLLQSREIAR